MTVWLLLLLLVIGQTPGQVPGALTPTSPAAPDSLWRCSNPAKPFRYVRDPDKKKMPPPCTEWVEIRGRNLAKILDAFSTEQFASANLFLAEAGELTDVKYPTAAGVPVPTTTVYRKPDSFGFKVADAEGAPTGSFVVYDGLGGILIETRKSESEPWTKQVLYPSAVAKYHLMVSDVDIPGMPSPRVLVRKEFF